MVTADEILKTVWRLRHERLANNQTLPMSISGNGVFGLPVVVSRHLPIVPSDGENARRIVRHGMADILAWLGEKVGPKPFEETHALLSHEHLLVSYDAYFALTTDPRMVHRAG